MKKKNNLDVFKTHGSNLKLSKFSRNLNLPNLMMPYLKHLNGLNIIKIYYEAKKILFILPKLPFQRNLLT